MFLAWAQRGSTGFARQCAGNASALPQAGKLAGLANGGLSKGLQGVVKRMSDTVWVALVTGIPGIVASILRYVDRRDIRRAVALGEKNAALGAKNEQHLAETKAAMVTLEKNTNSIKDELVSATRTAALARGNLEGRAELKVELHESNGESEEHSG